MSKLAEQITAVITNKKGAILEPYLVNMSMTTIEDPFGKYGRYTTKIRFKAEFGTEYYIAENEKDKILYVLEEVRRQVIEEVFGEFRKPLHEIRHLLFKREYDKVEIAVEKLTRQMFDV